MNSVWYVKYTIAKVRRPNLIRAPGSRVENYRFGCFVVRRYGLIFL